MTLRKTAARKQAAGIKKWEFPVYVCSQETLLATKGTPMKPIVLKVRFSVKERLLKNLQRCRHAGDRLRYLMVINVLSGRSSRQTAEVLQVHNTTVARVIRRFRAY